MKSVIVLYRITMIATAILAAGQSVAQENAPQFRMVWSIDGGLRGTDRSLDRTIAITPERIFIDAFVPKGERNHEVIRTFDTATSRPGAMISHPDGEAFEGLGDYIAVNDRFLVTALSGKAQFGVDGELLVYDAQTLELQRRIPNPRQADSTFFAGTGVVLHDDSILTAVPQSTDNISTAWVFSAETGEVLLTIDEPDVPRTFFSRPSRSIFGRSMAMNDTHIAIAANDRDGPQGLSAWGIVFVFDAKDGSLLYRLRTPGSDKASGFGTHLAMSEDHLYVAGMEETGELDWPMGQLHAFDLDGGELVFTIDEPDVPLTVDDFSAGKEGTGFPAALTIDGPYLFSGLPNWSGGEPRQGGLIVFDARTGTQLLRYNHQSGESLAAFGDVIAADHGYLAVQEEFRIDGLPAARVMLFEVTQP